MNLFFRRPLALFCAFFLVTSLLMIGLGYELKLLLLAVVGVAAVIFAVMVFIKRESVLLIGVLLCLIFIATAVANFAFRIDAKEKDAERWLGERQIVADVTEAYRTAEYSSIYVVEMKQISGNEASVKTLLILGFECELQVGDRIVTAAEIVRMSDEVMGRSGTEINYDKDILLTAVVYEPGDTQIFRFDRELSLIETLMCENGIKVAADSWRSTLTGRVQALLGEDHGAVVNGLLFGDTSDVSAEVLRDFRRTGVFHLFAVSGLHISVLLGALELLLKKLFVPKWGRCATVTVAAILLLVLTGFSMSALRSVFMLWTFYVVFTFSEEADSVTALFFSAFVILLIFPYAVFELGLWMSFLATLGLVTLYKLADRAIPKGRNLPGVLKSVVRFSRGMLMVALMTVLSTMFLLPIQWAIFGEISATALPANVILAPLNVFMLICSVLCLALGGIPFLGTVLCESIKGVCIVIIKAVDILSGINGATVSLKFGFAKPIVMIFFVTLLVLLTVRLKRKWLLAMPFVGFFVSFFIAVNIFYAVTPRSLTYFGDDDREIISVTDGSELCVIDMSNGGYDRMDGVIEDAERYGATDVDTLVLAQVSRRHVTMAERLFGDRVVGRIFLPEITDVEDAELLLEICALADESGVESFVYRSGDVIEVGNTRLMMFATECDGRLTVSAFAEGESTLVGYTDSLCAEGEHFSVVNSLIEGCDTVLVGNNGESDRAETLDIAEGATLIYASEEIREALPPANKTVKAYVSEYDKIKIGFTFK